MAEISLEAVTGKLNQVGYEAFMRGLRQAKSAGNRNLELAHWLVHVAQRDDSDLSVTVDHFKLDRARLIADLGAAVDGLRRNETEMPSIAHPVIDALDRGWHYATLFFGETQIRTGHILVALLKSTELRRALTSLSKLFNAVPVDDIMGQHRALWSRSAEENLQPLDGSGLRAAGAGGPPAQPGKSTTALDRFSQDLTARAAAGGMDPIRGRDEEVRQLIDVLMRRRQNNPILTGEAGVGKTAVVEGFAQKIVAGDVPPALRGVRLYALDVGLLQAGASMKGEFEQRLRAVIDEVQASPTPLLLFIDEAHTLIGAGGAAGTGDAANLLKPALARGTLRTIAATTWAEYRQYFEKDPALTRRFQPIAIDEPDAARCRDMLRGLVGPMEKHHAVRVTDAAISAAVALSQRYIPARQLPDKAVSLLDTACARVAISQSTTPAAIADLHQALAALAAEEQSLVRERDLGTADERRIADIGGEVDAARAKLAELEAAWQVERELVGEVHRLRDLAVEPQGEAVRAELRRCRSELDAIEPARRMIYPEVGEGVVEAVVSDWTGIPVGRMVKDEIESVLNLPAILNRRVVGQMHGLEMIARRVETSRAKLDNPDKPVGVFMLCGPSGVGKTETALALAEALYGGAQNVITINMSEFQEAHTVATLKGAPPGYVGYGEGGRLTEAVRRRPYSVVLLDEVEKAHPDVHEIFFQVFDKGVMEDGTGRRIDFRNTLIILTSNVGTELIVERGDRAPYRDDPAALAAALRPDLLRVFPPALLGRIVTIPYYPLSRAMLGAIIRLQLDRIGRRIGENHGAAFRYDDGVVDHIAAQCNDPDSGGRMIDNVVTNTLLPALSRTLLNRALAKQRVAAVSIAVEGGDFTYGWTGADGAGAPVGADA